MCSSVPDALRQRVIFATATSPIRHFIFRFQICFVSAGSEHIDADRAALGGTSDQRRPS
jgi:hypothetical protein